MKTLVNFIIIAKLDNCNPLFLGVSAYDVVLAIPVEFLSPIVRILQRFGVPFKPFIKIEKSPDTQTWGKIENDPRDHKVETFRSILSLIKNCLHQKIGKQLDMFSGYHIGPLSKFKSPLTPQF